MKGVSPRETNGPIGRQAADEPEAQAVIRPPWMADLLHRTSHVECVAILEPAGKGP